MSKYTKNLTSIIIPNWLTTTGGKIVPENETLWFAKHCIQRIKDNTKVPYELILIDNGSVIGSDYLKREADVYIRNEENLGFAKAVNQGIEASKGEYICVINNDVFVWPDWLRIMISELNRTDLNPKPLVIMPALVKETKSALEALEIKSLNLDLNYYAMGSGAEFGSCWLTRREYLDIIKEKDGHYLDENFKYGFGEDRDLWSRLRYHLKGETYRTHKTRVFHQGNVTIGKIINRKKYTYANREYLQKLREKRGY